jgi:hypothetical protein
VNYATIIHAIAAPPLPFAINPYNNVNNVIIPKSSALIQYKILVYNANQINFVCLAKAVNHVTAN